MSEVKDTPTPAAQVSAAPVGLWLVAAALLISLGVASRAVPVPPTTFGWRVAPVLETEELPSAPPSVISVVGTVAPNLPAPTAAATEPPVPPAAPGTDAPGVEACARAAERLAYSTSYEAAINAFDLCLPGAGRPETIRDMVWRYAKLLVDGYREADARKLYEAVASDAPDVPQSHNRLAWYLLTTSEYRSPQQLSADRVRALVAAEEAVRLSNRQDNKILDTLAEALLQNGRRDDALRVLEEIATLTRKPIYPARLEQFVAGRSRFMLTHEYSEEHRQGRAWTRAVERLSDAATLGELAEDEVRALSPVERCTLRNAIFARHGQRLGVRWLDEIFTQRSWYRANPGFNAERDLTPLDLRNIAVIRAIEAGLSVPAAADSPAPPGEDTPPGSAARVEQRDPFAVQDRFEATKTPSKGGTYEVDDLLAAIDGKKPGGGRGTGPPAPQASVGEVAQTLPLILTKPQILGVVKSGASAISRCKERNPFASGTVIVTIEIGRSGHVDFASAKAPFARTPVGDCVESTVRSFIFPPFSGEPMTINMPFAL